MDFLIHCHPSTYFTYTNNKQREAKVVFTLLIFFLPDCHVHTKEPSSSVAHTLLHRHPTLNPGHSLTGHLYL